MKEGEWTELIAAMGILASCIGLVSWIIHADVIGPLYLY